MKVIEQTMEQFSNNTDYIVTLVDTTPSGFFYSITTPDGDVRHVRPSPRMLSAKGVRQLYHKVLVAGKYNSGVIINADILSAYSSLASQESCVLEHLTHFIENRLGSGVTLTYGTVSYYITYETLFRKKLSTLYAELTDSPLRDYITTSKSLYSGKPSRTFIVALNRYKRQVEYSRELAGYGESVS